MIKFACPGCGKTFRVDNALAGRHARCRACGTRIQVPGAEPPRHDKGKSAQIVSQCPVPPPISESLQSSRFAADAKPKPQVDSGASQLTAIGNVEPVCPYCRSRLDGKPGRKMECPQCSNFIYVRTRPLDNQKVLVTEEQKRGIEEQWSIVNDKLFPGTHERFLVERRAHDEERAQVAREFGGESRENGIRWSLHGSDTDCPYCGKAIVPKPVRHRKCPHCRQPIRVRRNRLLTEAQEKQCNVEVQRQREMKEQEKRLRLKRVGRENSLRQLQEAKQMQRETGGGIGVEVLSVLSNTTCDFCANMDGKVIRAEQCTPDDIPPWPQCTCEEGCRCTIVIAFGLDMPKGWTPQQRK